MYHLLAVHLKIPEYINLYEENVISCDTCHKVFQYRGELEDHRKTHVSYLIAHPKIYIFKDPLNSSVISHLSANIVLENFPLKIRIVVICWKITWVSGSSVVSFAKKVWNFGKLLKICKLIFSLNFHRFYGKILSQGARRETQKWYPVVPLEKSI